MPIVKEGTYIKPERPNSSIPPGQRDLEERSVNETKLNNKEFKAYVAKVHRVLNNVLGYKYPTLAIAAGLAALKIRELEEENKQCKEHIKGLRMALGRDIERDT